MLGHALRGGIGRSVTGETSAISPRAITRWRMAPDPFSEIQMVRPGHNSGFHVRRAGNSAATRWTVGI